MSILMKMDLGRRGENSRILTLLLLHTPLQLSCISPLFPSGISLHFSSLVSPQIPGFLSSEQKAFCFVETA